MKRKGAGGKRSWRKLSDHGDANKDEIVQVNYYDFTELASNLGHETGYLKSVSSAKDARETGNLEMTNIAAQPKVSKQVGNRNIDEKDKDKIFKLDVEGEKPSSKNKKRANEKLTVEKILDQKSSRDAIKRSSKSADNKKLRRFFSNFTEESVALPGSGDQNKILKIAKYLSSSNSSALISNSQITSSQRKTVTIKDSHKRLDIWNGNLETQSEDHIASNIKKIELQAKQHKSTKAVPSQRPPVSYMNDGSQPSAVDRPQTAYSYNPRVGEWLLELRKRGRLELRKERRRLGEIRKAEKLKLAAKHIKPIQTLSDEEDDGGDVGTEVPSAAEKKIIERLKRLKMERLRPKTEKQRKRASQRNIRSFFERKARIEQHKLDEIDRLNLEQVNSLNTEEGKVLITKLEKDVPILQSQRKGPAGIIRQALARKRRLSRYTLPERPLELKLPDELCESLRQLTPEGNPLFDRFYKFQERGLVEPRLPFKQNKERRRTNYKVKTKHRFKDG